MSKFTTTAVAALLMSSSTYAFAQVADVSYYDAARISSFEANEFFVRDRYTAADAHYYEGLDPEPIRLGAFDARPVLLLQAQNRENVFLDGTNEVSDTVISIRPSISAASNWSRHMIGFDASVDHQEYMDLSDESATQYGLRGFGQLDVSSSVAFAGSAIVQNLREDRTSIGGVLNTVERVEIDRTGGEANAIYAQNRLRLRGRIRLTDNDYSDAEAVGGGMLDQDFRDHNETTISASAEYAVSRDWSVIGEIEHIDRDYDQPNITALDRDITGYSFRAGANFELPVNLRGEVAAQIQEYDPADPSLDTIEQFGLDASVFWFPTQLTTASFFASQGVEDAGNTGAANTQVTRYGVGIDHELLRTLLLSGDAYFETREFNPIGREDDQTVFDLAATWKLNPNMQLRGGYRHVNQDSVFDSFDDNIFTITLRFFP